MPLYYCPASQGFYDAAIHAVIPATAIAITPEQHEQLLNALNSGSLVLPDLSIVPPPPPAPDTYHIWDEAGQKWTLPPENAAQRLADAKAAKLHELNSAVQNFINRTAHLDQTPDFEIRTWVIQAAEAKAWAVNPNAPTPILDNIATARGVPPNLLKQKALEKAQAFEQLTATVAGLRQAIEDQIHAATTLEDLNAIDTTIRLPEANGKTET